MFINFENNQTGNILIYSNTLVHYI
jgi:hypothetical protein